MVKAKLAHGVNELLVLRHPTQGLLVNVCQHTLHLDDGTVLEPSGWVLNAKPTAEKMGRNRQRTSFESCSVDGQILQHIENECQEEIKIVTSIIGLQAYAEFKSILVSPVLTPETARSDNKVAYHDRWNCM